MGACGSTDSGSGNDLAVPATTESPGGKVQTVAAESHQSAGIDRVLDKAKQEEDSKVKLLLLGAGESGKSTIFKQMRIIYGTPPSEQELKYYGVVVRSNTVVAIRKLAILLEKLGLEDELRNEKPGPDQIDPFSAYEEVKSCIVQGRVSPEAPVSPVSNGVGGTKDWIGTCQAAGITANEEQKVFLNHKDAISALWQSETMKKVWAKRNEANIIDGHKDYLQDVPRIASPQYRPTQQDILLSRVRTTAVICEKYRIESIDFEMYDVGGQRSERRKWIDAFENVDAVIFVAALSEYDQSLAEARRANRMVEALELFRSVCNNRAFLETSIMLFLNKKDIFAEKIKFSNIADQRPFADYSGPKQNFDEGVLYFIQKFKDCLLNEEFSDSFIHVTCATDTNNMEFVLDSTRTIIMTNNLRNSGFLGAA